MANVKEPITGDQLRTVPANQASWVDLDAIFGFTEVSHPSLRRVVMRLDVPQRRARRKA